MSNMSYCRFENTVKDLEDCVENWDDVKLGEIDEDSGEVTYEADAKARMITLAKLIVAWSE